MSVIAIANAQLEERVPSLRSRRYSRAQGGKLEISPAQKLSILSSAHRAHGSAHTNVFALENQSERELLIMLLAGLQCSKRCQFNNCFVFFCHGEQNNSHETFHICPILAICIRSTNPLYRRYVSFHRTVVIYRRTIFYRWQIVVQYRKFVIQSIHHTDNLYPIDKSALPTVRFVPSDSCYLPSDNVLRMATCFAMQEVRNTIFIAFLSRWFPS